MIMTLEHVQSVSPANQHSGRSLHCDISQWWEIWTQNTTHPVTWSYTGSPGSTVKIELLKNGIFYQLLTSSTSIGSAGSARIHGRLKRIQNLVLIIKSGLPGTSNLTYYDTSNANFTLSAARCVTGLGRKRQPGQCHCRDTDPCELYG